MRAILIGLALAAWLAAAGQAAAAEKYIIDNKVWGWYQQYLRAISNGTKPGAFAITKDGSGAFYSWCGDIRCMAGPSYSHEAVTGCEREFDTECVLFALRDEIRVEYEVVGSATKSSSDIAPAVAPQAKTPPSAITSAPEPADTAAPTQPVSAPAVATVEPAAAEAVPENAILVDGQIWSSYQQYLRAISNGIKPGAFAITKDGLSAFSSWCQDIRCSAGPTYSQDALGNCQRKHGSQCVLFAVRDQIQVPYQVIARHETTANAPIVEPRTTRIAVTPDVQETIEIYLRNVQSVGRVWALAIAKDGTEAAMASCASGSTYAGGRACYPVSGTKEDLAKREALARCGAPGECLLLYVGPQKQGDVEVVMR
jgi:hypothetical protein